MEWIEKYRPTTIDQLIISDENKAILINVLDKVPNLLLHGDPGTGKSSFVKILLATTGAECLKINASMDGSVDIIRTKVQSFAGSFDPDIKFVYFEEADRLTNAAQDSLKDLIDRTKDICRYIFVTNHVNSITQAISSRCVDVCFDNPPKDKIISLCERVLYENNRHINDLDDIIKYNYPDIRAIINKIEYQSKR